MPRSFKASLAAAVLLSLAASQADAHAKLVASTPAAGATIASPNTITLTFNERLVPAFSSFDLARGDGGAVGVKVSMGADHKSLVGAPQARLKPGAYKIMWHAAAADDGHRMSGAIDFTVKD